MILMIICGSNRIILLEKYLCNFKKNWTTSIVNSNSAGYVDVELIPTCNYVLFIFGIFKCMDRLCGSFSTGNARAWIYLTQIQPGMHAQLRAPSIKPSSNNSTVIC